MRKPIGVFIAGVILLVAGLLGLLTVSLGLLGITSLHSGQWPMTGGVRFLTFGAETITGLVSMFLCWVAVGLFGLRSWSRYAAIVVAALGACFCGVSALTLVLLLHSAPPVRSLPSGAQHHLFVLLAAFYFLLSAIAIFWVVYFNREPVRRAFAEMAARRQGQDAYGRVILPDRHRHSVINFAQIVVWIVGGLCLIGGLSMIVILLLGAPMFLLGWLVTGVAAFVVEILWAGILLYAGLGLIFRWRGGWILAVALQFYSLLSVILLLVPGYPQRLIQASHIVATRLSPGVTTTPVNPPFLIAASSIGGLVALGILVALLRCRKSYLP